MRRLLALEGQFTASSVLGWRLGMGVFLRERTERHREEGLA